MSDDQLKNWLIVNARAMGKTTATALIAEELMKRLMFPNKTTLTKLF